MSDLATVLLAVYVAGMAVGLARTDARWPARVGLSLLWPVGPLAFLITVAVLLGASLIAFPILGAIVIAVALAIAVLV